VFVPGRPFSPSPIFVGKASSLPESGANERCFYPDLPANKLGWEGLTESNVPSQSQSRLSLTLDFTDAYFLKKFSCPRGLNPSTACHNVSRVSIEIISTGSKLTCQESFRKCQTLVLISVSVLVESHLEHFRIIDDYFIL